MDYTSDKIQFIRRIAKKRVLFLPHAIHQMSRTDRLISTQDVHMAMENGKIIELYPEDKRGSSCLILGYGEKKRPIHIVCAIKKDYVAIITAYLPNLTRWENNFIKRK